MDNQLFLSIIIPVYNMEHYIVPCLESIFANRDIDKNLFKKVDKVMQEHLEIRHINGGNATKMKYERLRKG